jgi:hypothetical protein
LQRNPNVSAAGDLATKSIELQLDDVHNRPMAQLGRCLPVAPVLALLLAGCGAGHSDAYGPAGSVRLVPSPDCRKMGVTDRYRLTSRRSVTTIALSSLVGRKAGAVEHELQSSGCVWRWLNGPSASTFLIQDARPYRIDLRVRNGRVESASNG